MVLARGFCRRFPAPGRLCGHGIQLRPAQGREAAVCRSDRRGLLPTRRIGEEAIDGFTHKFGFGAFQTHGQTLEPFDLAWGQGQLLTNDATRHTPSIHQIEG
jgi:hypothetical protein